jgi:thiamine-phosphate pyrophosphorylase
MSELAKLLRLHTLIPCELPGGQSPLAVASATLRGGATVIQLRDKTASTRQLVTIGEQLRVLTHQYGALLIVNDRVDVALAVEADGAHVGQDDMPADRARALLGDHRLLGVSAATPSEAKDALAYADYFGVGPIFQTSGKADAGPAIGIEAITTLRQCVNQLLVAIGGLTSERAVAVITAGADGIAIITAIVADPDPEAATRACLNAISAAEQH